MFRNKKGDNGLLPEIKYKNDSVSSYSSNLFGNLLIWKLKI
jgi:hypothetical protein